MLIAALALWLSINAAALLLLWRGDHAERLRTPRRWPATRTPLYRPVLHLGSADTPTTKRGAARDNR